jgi:hypothetical protein
MNNAYFERDFFWAARAFIGNATGETDCVKALNVKLVNLSADRWFRAKL